jgi:hypothetical protein
MIYPTKNVLVKGCKIKIDRYRYRFIDFSDSDVNIIYLYSVADPGCFIPDPDPSICSSRISNPGSRIPDLESRISDPGS